MQIADRAPPLACLRSFTTVFLSEPFSQAFVVVCTPLVGLGTPESITARVRNIALAPPRFEVAAQKFAGNAGNPATVTMHCFASEEGIFNDGAGLRFEAASYLAT